MSDSMVLVRREPPKWLTVKEAAEKMGVSADEAKDALQRHRVRFKNWEGLVVYDPFAVADLAELLKHRRPKP